MAIWVSRYSNKELKTGRYYPVGISLGRPRWPLGYDIREQCYTLAPRKYMLDIEDQEEYRKLYIEKLEEIGSDKIIAMIRNMDRSAASENKELVLLCFEDVREENNWCHRSMFAEWWKDKTGEVVMELHDPSEPKTKKAPKPEPQEEPKEEYTQMSLFDIVGFAT